MRTQQEAEKAEQQRIKNLVLNYDLRDEAEPDGTASPFPLPYTLHPNPNRKQQSSAENNPQGLDSRQLGPYAQPRLDKGGTNRGHQRARKLQLSDVDWYGHKPTSSSSPATNNPAETPSATNNNNAKSRRADSTSPGECYRPASPPSRHVRRGRARRGRAFGTAG